MAIRSACAIEGRKAGIPSAADDHGVEKQLRFVDEIGAGGMSAAERRPVLRRRLEDHRPGPRPDGGRSQARRERHLSHGVPAIPSSVCP